MNAYAKAATALFSAHVPAAAVEYCVQLYFTYRFRFSLRKTRITKAGDFTHRQGHAPRITVNDDLHPYNFLITYIHEVAHVDVHQQYGYKVEAHGKEWKAAFQRLLAPMLNTEVFPSALLASLKKHMANPMASSFSDPELTAALRHYDPTAVTQTILSQLPFGAVFLLNGRWFKKGKLRRTRFECEEVKTKKHYLVPMDAPVDGVQ